MLKSFIFVSLLFLPLAARGATRKIQLNLCCLRYSGEVRSLILKSDVESEPTEVNFYQGGFTEPVPALLEDGKVVVYKREPTAKSGWIKDWTFSVSSDGTEATAILLPVKPKDDPAAPYSAFVLPSLSAFNYGSVLAINLTTHNAHLALGAQQIALTPGATKSANLQAEADAYNMVPVAVSIQTDNKWLTLHTTQWSYNPRFRQISMIWMDATADRPEITSIRQMLPYREETQ